MSTLAQQATPLVYCLFCATFCFLTSIVCWAADCCFFFTLFSFCLAHLATYVANFSFSCLLLSFMVSVSLRTHFLFKSGSGNGGGVSNTDSMSDCLDLCSFKATFWKVNRPLAAYYVQGLYLYQLRLHYHFRG